MNKYEKWRGHEIEKAENGKWYHAGTKQLVTDDVNRNCGYCGKSQTKEGHDACIGTLPNIMNTCCGHGNIKEAYVQFWDTSCIRGAKAKKYIEEHKNNK